LSNPGEILVIKIGGSTLGSHDTTLKDVVSLHSRGLRPVVVHGGGNKVTEWLERLGVETRFARGRRVTDTEALQVVIAVLAGLVNKEIVSIIISLGGNAVGLSGTDGGLIRAEIREP
jgi:acetylglutamate kinase